jgi:hypothetical protein
MQKKLVIAAAVATILVNVMANVIPYNGKTTAQISDSFAIYFVPAGYVFAIWGLIYVAILAYVYYQFKYTKVSDIKHIDEINAWFLISCLGNSVWIILWHYDYYIATFFMMAMLLISLIGAYLEIKKIKKQDRKFFWMVKAPFSLYLGWISVATIANISAILFSVGIDGGDNAVLWAAIMMVVAGILAVVMVLREKDYIYPGVIIWALIGIAVKFSMVSMLVWTTVVVTIVIAVSVVVTRFGLVAQLKSLGKKSGK